MVVQFSSCDPKRLQRLLADRLNADELSAMEQHLDECAICCRRLEELAAGEPWWEEASSFLGPDETEAGGATSADVDDSHPLSKVDDNVDGVPLGFLEESDDPAILGRLGDYEIVEPIGAGGMGVVLKGYDPELNRYVAVKVLAPHYASSSAARKRFAREAKAAAAVVHPHVLAIHSVDASGDLPFLVMPFVQGESLQQRINREGPLKLEEILRIGSQAARGLQAAHDQGIVHRDIKPGNILLEKSVERVMLTDFGLARAVDDASMTRSGVIAGTPQYMSPEQAIGESVDSRSDLFSLGSVLYTMAAGRPPFRAENAFSLLNRIVEDSPRPIREINTAIPQWFGAIVAALHTKSPEDRLESADQLAELLEGCLAHVQQPMTVDLPRPVRKLNRRRGIDRALSVARYAAVVVLVIAASVFFGQMPGTNVGEPFGTGANDTTEAPADATSAHSSSPTIPDDEPAIWNEGLDGELLTIDDEIRNLELQLAEEQSAAEMSDSSSIDSSSGHLPAHRNEE